MNVSVCHAGPMYELTRPGVILTRLLKRNSGEMISRLRREIAARATR